MHLIYVDESGTPDIKDSENFVLGALIINEDKWFEVNKGMSDLKEKYFSKNFDDLEIHMVDSVHRKYYFSKFVIEKRIEVIKDIVELIKKIEMRTVYVVIKKRQLLKDIDIRYWAYEFLFERLCYQLKDMNKEKEKIEYGLLIFDSISKKRNSEIWNLVSKLLKEGGWYEKNEHLIDGPVFSESNVRTPLQLADCIAYAVNHNYKTNQNKDKNMSEELKHLFEVAEQKIPTDKRYARKIFP